MSSSSSFASSTSYSSVILSSFPSNPLTTTFTPPPQCTGWYVIRNPPGSNTGIVVYGQDSTCLPSGFDQEPTSYFSPGLVCPSGYRSACHDYAGVASITTVTCCPISDDIVLSCANPETLKGPSENLFCTWAPTSTSRPTTTVAVTQSANGTTSTITVTPAWWWGVNAFGVRMVYESSDLAPASTSATTSHPPRLTGSSSTATPSPTQSSNGFSLGAEIAVGVTVPVAVISAIAIGMFLWRKRSRSRANTKDTSRDAIPESKSLGVHEAEGVAIQEADGIKTYRHYEVEGIARHEADGIRAYRHYELEGRGLPSELPANFPSQCKPIL